MLKIIKTQNGDLINYANIVEIHLAEGEGINDNRQATTMFALVANDTSGKELELGIFDTQAQLEEVFGGLEIFLSYSTETLFEVPDETNSEDNEND